MKETYDKPRQHIKKQRHYFADKVPYSQRCSFSSSLVWMWELDNKESWTLKNWCFWALVVKMTLESPLNSKKFKPVNPKGNQSWIFITRTGAEALVLGHMMQRADSLEKTLILGKIEGCRRGMTKAEMVGWHDQLNGQEIEQALGDGEGQGSLVCCRPWGHSQTQLNNWTKTIYKVDLFVSFWVIVNFLKLMTETKWQVQEAIYTKKFYNWTYYFQPEES